MKIQIGDMFDTQSRIAFVKETNKPLVILVTTNGVLNKKGEVVMGRGGALQLKQLIPTFPKQLGNYITNIGYLASNNNGVYYKYGICIPSLAILSNNPASPIIHFGAFQSKEHWFCPSSKEIIKFSVDMLQEFLKSFDVNVWLNYPGINNGKLVEEEVYPLIKNLPDNVMIWKQQ